MPYVIGPPVLTTTFRRGQYSPALWVCPQSTVSVLAVFCVIFVVVAVTGGAWLLITKPLSILSDTLDRDNVKYNYEWFKQRHEDIDAIDVKIRLAVTDVNQFKEDAGPRKGWKREDRIESSRLRAVSTGLQQQRADLAADYNARSRMVNRAIFKGNDTPERISVEGKTK